MIVSLVICQLYCVRSQIKKAWEKFIKLDDRIFSEIGRWENEKFKKNIQVKMMDRIQKRKLYHHITKAEVDDFNNVVSLSKWKVRWGNSLTCFVEIEIWYMIWYDMIWYDIIWYDMIWYDMIWYDMIWYDLIWFDVIYDMIYDMIWYDKNLPYQTGRQSESVFTDEDNQTMPQIDKPNFPPCQRFKLMLLMWRKIHGELKIHKATGPDGVPSQILRECASEIAPALSVIFQFPLYSGCLPEL